MTCYAFPALPTNTRAIVASTVLLALIGTFLEITGDTPVAWVALAGEVDTDTMIVAVLRADLLGTNFTFVSVTALANTIGAARAMATTELTIQHRASWSTAVRS